jgi:hypothetical protein
MTVGARVTLHPVPAVRVPPAIPEKGLVRRVFPVRFVFIDRLFSSWGMDGFLGDGNRWHTGCSRRPVWSGRGIVRSLPRVSHGLPIFLMVGVNYDIVKGVACLSR